jgi:hypothetical protein
VGFAGCGRSSLYELLADVDVEGRAGDGGVGHEVDGKSGDAGRATTRPTGRVAAGSVPAQPAAIRLTRTGAI